MKRISTSTASSKIKYRDNRKIPYCMMKKGASIILETGMEYGRKSAFIVSDKSVDTWNGKVSFAKHVGFITKFRNELCKSLLEKPKLQELKISRLCRTIPLRDFYYDKYDQFPEGKRFVEVDIQKAYFQTAYKIGYISKEFFEENFDQDQFKQSMRECVTWLSTKRSKEYYNVEGMEDGYEIKCCNEPFSRVYENIQNMLYKTIRNIVEACELECVQYNIDAVTVEGKYAGIVRKYLEDNGWMYKTSICRKINDFEYKCGVKIKYARRNK